MRFKDEKHFGLRVDSDTLTRFRFASSYEGRSANAQLVILMRDFIAKYEEKMGRISEEDLKDIRQG